jgi:hypothetical protein
MRFLFFLIVFVSLASAQDIDRFVKHFLIGTNRCVVVAEGDEESRSIGSYTVRLYRYNFRDLPTDWYLSGQIRPRDGTIEDVVFRDVVGDGESDVVVIIRCAGTGSYLSADAFGIHGNKLVLLAHVEDLGPDADCVAALRKAVRGKL